MSTRKPYVLKPGGSVGRHEPDGFRVYKPYKPKPGDKPGDVDVLYLTDEEAAGVAFKGRLMPAPPEVVAESEGRQAAATKPTTAKTAAAKPTAKSATDTAAPTAPTDYSFIHDLPALEVIQLIKNLETMEETDAIRAAEMGEDGHKRLKVRDAATKRKRQLIAARARAAKDVKADERALAEAVAATKDAAGEVDDEK